MTPRSAALLLTLAALAACSDPSAPAAPRPAAAPTAAPALALAAAQPGAGAQRIPGRYIVVLKDAPEAMSTRASRLAARHRGTLRHVYSAVLKGFAAEMSDADAQLLAADPEVAYVEPDEIVRAHTIQQSAPWGLDRIDQRSLPLSSGYTYLGTGAGVHAYILDTGIRYAHAEFGGRAVKGIDLVTVGGTAEDCGGHGTHVAGSVGGKTYGVAKGVKLYSVRVLDCAGQAPKSRSIAGMDWVRLNHVKPAVVNMSLGGATSQAQDDAVAALTAAGVTVVVSAGNRNMDACLFSPARAPAAIAVGATTNTDARPDTTWWGSNLGSNWGTCVDIFAPGDDILSAGSWSNSATDVKSGTSMAAPHVTGAVALMLEKDPGASPAIVRWGLVSRATEGKVKNPGAGSPNRLLYAPF